MRKLILLCLLLSVSALAQNNSSFAQQRARHLRRGINLSEWFAQVYDPKGYTKEHLVGWVTADDVALIKSMGFDHVRLSINPAPMMHHNEADRIPGDYLGYLDGAVKMVLDHGLAVILDMHPDSDFKAKLVQRDDEVEQFSDFWRALAHHYSTYDPEMVYFEILNEPEFRDRYRWAGVQAKLAAAIRDGAPKHTIIAAGANWSDIDDLLELTPLSDPNVIYNFHFYDPHTFTHQGATWGENYWHFETKLAYPAEMHNAEQVASEQPDRLNRLRVLRYALDHWDANRIAVEIGQAAEWAKHWNVPLTCNEFGVYRRDSDPQDRARWIHDVRATLEHDGIGWNMWDYGARDDGGGFGVVNGPKEGPNTPDEVTVQALGLKH
ncbi:MAG TPA: cellulase family glycosylhydrolase [Terriglobales bacterium]|nr:cellulase family glycosylhydrolase [Terriglobales bacterium]